MSILPCRPRPLMPASTSASVLWEARLALRAQPIACGRWGYGCSGCAVAYCSAVRRGRGFDVHACGAADGGNALALAAAAPAPGPLARAIADVVIPVAEGFRAMLELATSRPALQTMEWIPRKHRVRTAEVLRDFYGAHAVAAGRLLWLGPTLLLRSRATYDDDVLAPPVAEAATKGVERASMVRWSARACRWLSLASGRRC